MNCLHKKEKLPWRTAFQALKSNPFVNLNVLQNCSNYSRKNMRYLMKYRVLITFYVCSQ